MGSKGSKPRKPAQHLPKVGSPENLAYEHRTERKDVFGSWPMWIVAVGLLAILVAWVVITL
jgi:hypothetical protein